MTGGGGETARRRARRRRPYPLDGLVRTGQEKLIHGEGGHEWPRGVEQREGAVAGGVVTAVGPGRRRVGALLILVSFILGRFFGSYV